jgi:2-C-methyl-D-erythritol 4-phosphate cytidylyltransferase
LSQTLGAIVVAAGGGLRFGDADKVFATLGGQPVLAYALRLMAAERAISAVALVMGQHNLSRGAELVAALGLRDVVVCTGGATRSASVQAGLRCLDPDVTLVAIHDAARPLASVGLLRRVLRAGDETGAAVPAVAVTDTIYEVDDDGSISNVIERSRLRAIQTPQVFRRDWLEQAFSTLPDATTDEGSLLHATGYAVETVPGERQNLKLTSPDDLVVAEALLSAGLVQV